MKAIEELLIKHRDSSYETGQDEYEQAILSRFSALEDKVKKLEKENDNLRVTSAQNEESLKVALQQNAELKRQVEELRCCGNCDHFYVDSEDIITCQNDVYPFPVKGKCDSWQSDRLTQKERENE
jgi:hypothetical protein